MAYLKPGDCPACGNTLLLIMGRERVGEFHICEHCMRYVKGESDGHSVMWLTIPIVPDEEPVKEHLRQALEAK